MKIIKIIEIDEPHNCDRCNDIFNGIYIVFLRLFPRFLLKISLCENCLNKLRKVIK